MYLNPLLFIVLQIVLAILILGQSIDKRCDGFRQPGYMLLRVLAVFRFQFAVRKLLANASLFARIAA